MSFSKSKPGSNQENKETKIEPNLRVLQQQIFFKPKQKPGLRTARDMLAKCKMYLEYIVEQKQEEKYRKLYQCINNCTSALKNENYYDFLTHFEEFKIITDQQGFSLTKLFDTKNAFKTEIEELMKNDEWNNHLSVTLFNFKKYTEEKIKPFDHILERKQVNHKDYNKAINYSNLKDYIEIIKLFIEKKSGVKENDMSGFTTAIANIINTVQTLDKASYLKSNTEKAQFAQSLHRAADRYLEHDLKFKWEDVVKYMGKIDIRINTWKTPSLGS